MTRHEAAHDRRAAVEDLVESHHPTLLRLASIAGAPEDVAERTVIEGWRAALAAEEPASALFRTVLFREVITRVAALERRADGPIRPAVEADAFEPGDSRWAGWFTASPSSLDAVAPNAVPSADALSTAAEALRRLPLAQRVVVVLRDVAGWSPADVAELLQIDPARQRALLHAGRAHARRALERLAQTAGEANRA